MKRSDWLNTEVSAGILEIRSLREDAMRAQGCLRENGSNAPKFQLIH